MGELDDFLADILPRQLEAERALHNGDAEPRLKMWSSNDPSYRPRRVGHRSDWV
jgi:hypothetical protein